MKNIRKLPGEEIYSPVDYAQVVLISEIALLVDVDQ